MSTVEDISRYRRRIVKRPLNNAEGRGVNEFFGLCREMVGQRHKELLRRPP